MDLLKHKIVRQYLEVGRTGKPRPPQTTREYERALARFFTAADIGDKKGLLGLTRGDALLARDELLQTYAQGTARNTLAIARGLYTRLEDYEQIASNPLRGQQFQLEGSPVPEDNVLAPDDMERILKAPRGRNKLRDKAILLGILEHAWRASELCSLTWGSLRKYDGLNPEYAGRQGVVFRGKGDKLTWQPVNPEFLALCERWGGQYCGPNDPMISRHRRGPEPIDRHLVSRVVRRWTKAIGREGVTPHGLRATALSKRWAEQGKEAAQALAGHANVRTTERYDRWSKYRIRD